MYLRFVLLAQPAWPGVHPSPYREFETAHVPFANPLIAASTLATHSHPHSIQLTDIHREITSSLGDGKFDLKTDALH